MREQKAQLGPDKRFGCVLLCGGLAFTGYQFLVRPNTSRSREWNPTRPLVIIDPVTPLTSWKLNCAAASFDQCLDTLAENASVQIRDPLEKTAQCFINDRVSLAGVGDATLQPLETRCAIALRMAMWKQHRIQPAAVAYFVHLSAASRTKAATIAVQSGPAMAPQYG
jgi:hypothetical protein